MTRVAVAILRKEGRVLVCQRRKDASYGLKWEFPGGKLEPGETIVECLRRELREELSVDIRTIGRMESQAYRYDDGRIFDVAYCFVGEYTGTPTNNVFEEIRWVTIQELRALDNLDGNRAFISTLNESMFI